MAAPKKYPDELNLARRAAVRRSLDCGRAAGRAVTSRGTRQPVRDAVRICKSIAGDSQTRLVQCRAGWATAMQALRRSLTAQALGIRRFRTFPVPVLYWYLPSPATRANSV